MSVFWTATAMNKWAAMRLNLSVVAAMWLFASFAAASRCGYDELTFPPGVIFMPIRRIKDETAYSVQFQVGTPPQNVSAVIDLTTTAFTFESAGKLLTLWMMFAFEMVTWSWAILVLTWRFTTAYSARKQGLCQDFGVFDNASSRTAKYSGSSLSGGLAGHSPGSYINDTVSVYGTHMENTRFGFIDHTSRNSSNATQQIATLGLGGVCGALRCKAPDLVNQYYEQGLIGSRSFSIYLGDGGRIPCGHIIMGGMDKAKRWDRIFKPSMLDPIGDKGGKPYVVKVFDTKIQTLEFEPGPYHQYPKGGVNFLLSTESTRWAFPKKMIHVLLKRWKAPDADTTKRVRLHCAYRLSGTDIYQRINFGYNMQRKEDKVNVMIAPGTVQLEDESCATDFEETEMGGTLGNAFLRGVYLTMNYESMTMELVQADHRAQKRLKVIAI